MLIGLKIQRVFIVLLMFMSAKSLTMFHKTYLIVQNLVHFGQEIMKKP